jgi:hypothetical protein
VKTDERTTAIAGEQLCEYGVSRQRENTLSWEGSVVRARPITGTSRQAGDLFHGTFHTRGIPNFRHSNLFMNPAERGPERDCGPTTISKLVP